jgi:carbamoyl-phosphate synthase large subunit
MTDSITLTVAITGMNAKPDNPGPGVAVARCLKEDPRFDGHIIGLGYDALDPGLYLDDFVDSGYILPYPSAGEDALYERIAEIHNDKNIDVLIPCLDAELPNFIRMVPRLTALGIKTVLPQAEQFRLRNKDHLPELAEHAGIECPELKTLTKVDFFDDCHEKGWDYPLVIKGIFYDAYIVNHKDDARSAFRKIAMQWGYPVLVQKVVKGEEYNLTAIGDGKGRLIAPVMMKKMALTDKGKAWSGVSINDEKLLQAAEHLVAAINWRGPLELEVIKDRHGNYQLIEINPRFPAWIYLSHGVGRNLPMALLDIAMNHTRDYPDYQSGKLFIRYAEEQIIPMSEFEDIVMQGKREGRQHHE